MPSWRVLKTSEKWLTHSDLYNLKTEKYFEVDCEIVRVEQGEANNPGSNTVKKLPALFLRSLRTGDALPKPLGLNTGNAETIEGIAGSDDYKRWPGTLITLFVLPNARFGKKTRPGIRIKPQPPRAPAGWKPTTATSNTSTQQVPDRTAEGVEAEDARDKAAIEKAIGRSLDGNEQLTADEVKKVQEAQRAHASHAGGNPPFTEEEKRELERIEAEERARRK